MFQVYIYSGKKYIIALDDGINAALDTDENSKNGCGIGPGGNNGGWDGQGEIMEEDGTWGNMGLRNLQMNSQCLIFPQLYIWGDIYVNSGCDCFYENDNIYIQGDNLKVWGTISGDGKPIDLEGTLYIAGGFVFSGGTSGMEPMH